MHLLALLDASESRGSIAFSLRCFSLRLDVEFGRQLEGLRWLRLGYFAGGELGIRWQRLEQFNEMIGQSSSLSNVS